MGITIKLEKGDNQKMFKIRITSLGIVVLAMIGMSAGLPFEPAMLTATPEPIARDQWKRFKADSGYEISYPLELYSMRTGVSSPNAYFPGTKVMEPNDSFYYQEPRAVLYKVSIAVSTNLENLSLAAPQQLLTHGAIYLYAPELLTGKEIQQVTLDGFPAFGYTNYFPHDPRWHGVGGWAGSTQRSSLFKTQRRYCIHLRLAAA